MAIRTMLLLALAATASDAATVKREGVRVMLAPTFFAPACPAQVAPGQAVQILERRQAWARIAAPGDGRCWIHASAWSDRQAGERGGQGARASDRDVELAARGLTEDDVTRYGRDNPAVAAQIAAVRAYVERAPEAPPEDLARFVSAGQLGVRP